MTDENILLTPEDVENRRKRRKESIGDEKIKENSKFFNRGNTVAINYETLGRFNIPPTLYFKDFTTKHENDLSLTRKEDLLETTIAILNELKNDDADCKVEDMLIEEFFETLVGIKKQFDSSNHVHLWICSCQDDINTPHINESTIDLNSIQYKCISESDKILQNFYKIKFDAMTDEVFKEYLFIRHKDNPSIELENITKEEELKTIKVKEPFLINLDHRYLFRFPRIGDLVKAQKIADKEYKIQIKEVQNKKNPNAPLPNLQSQKDEEINRLKSEEFKFSSLATRALSLISIDGKELTDEERIKIYSSLNRGVKNKINDFLKQFEFGIYHEQEFFCPLCEEKDKRLLQREFDVYELLPSYPITNEDNKFNTTLDIYVGI